MMNKAYLQKISLITANFNDGIVLEDVLKDWFDFLGGRPGEVLIVDGGSDLATQAVYWDLFNRGFIDKLQIIQPHHKENNKETCYIQEHTAGVLASNPYLLWFKFDTLPYRQGHEDWLEEAIGYLEREDIFAISGALNRSWETHPAWNDYYFCTACTINFALMKRSSYITAMNEFAGSFIADGFEGEHPFGRMLLERCFMEYMRRHQKYALCKLEDPSWTVFHTNAHGDRLVELRQQFLSRHNIKKYMNPGLSTDVTQFLFYGSSPVRASWLRRVIIQFSNTRLGRIWRSLKAKLSWV